MDEAQLGGHVNKSINLEKLYKQLFLKEDLGHVKCIYRIISRLIFIEVLWESSYLNIPIKNDL